MEAIVRTTIPADKKALAIDLNKKGDYLEVSYEPEERLQESLNLKTLEDVVQGYKYYSENPVAVKMEEHLKIIQLPKLTYDESSDS